MTDYKWAFDQLERVGDIKRISRNARIVVRLVSANGIIGNGGFEYFFESNWHDGTQHHEFVQFYRDAGLESHAQIIEEACTLVGDLMHLTPEKRAILLQERHNSLRDLSMRYFKLRKEFEDTMSALKRENA